MKISRIATLGACLALCLACDPGVQSEDSDSGEVVTGASRDGALQWSLEENGVMTFETPEEGEPSLQVYLAAAAGTVEEIRGGFTADTPIWVLGLRHLGSRGQPCSTDAADCNPPPCKPTRICPPDVVGDIPSIPDLPAPELGITFDEDGRLTTQRDDLYVSLGNEDLTLLKPGEPTEVGPEFTLWSVELDIENQPCLLKGDCPPDPCGSDGLCPPGYEEAIASFMNSEPRDAAVR